VSNTITRSECPVHGDSILRLRGGRPFCMHCKAKPVERTYVAVDALEHEIFIRFPDPSTRRRIDNAIEAVKS
jgi:hypothetical protein